MRDEELTAGEIAEQFEVTRPAVSQHLRVLREAGLISERPEGTRRFYRSRPEGLMEVREFLEEYWRDSLMQLKSAMEVNVNRSKSTDKSTKRK